LALVSTGGFGIIQKSLADVANNQIWQDFLFALVLGIGLFLVGIPFSAYKTFVIEEKFGFNKTKVGTFITDRIKGLSVGMVILGSAILLLLWIYQQIPTQIWWVAFLVLMAIQFFTAAFGTSVILPLFNKLQQLPDGELREKILAMCKAQNYKVGRIFVMNSSKRSSKTNAFFSGLGKTKTIVLFDSLIEKNTTDQVVAVLGHEIGHDCLGHVRAGLITQTISGLLVFGLFGLVSSAPEVSLALGGTQTNIVLGVVGFVFLFNPLSFILDSITNTISRKNEHAADLFSAQIGNPKDIERALLKLSSDNLSNPNPHPLYVFMYYSHPTAKQRVAYLQERI
jgi:STE24 endopeptidase